MEISLTQGKIALIDDADWPLVSQYKWYADKRGTNYYARAWCVRRRKNVHLHRVILGAIGRRGDIDHKNGNGLDNQRQNLRFATRSQNVANQKKPSTNTSGFKGVSWSKSAQKWLAQIMRNRKTTYLGCYFSKEEAAKAYSDAAVKMFGEFACV